MQTTRRVWKSEPLLPTSPGSTKRVWFLMNLLSGTPTLADIRCYDALMIGGSGDYYVSKGNLPNFPAVLAVLAEVVAVGQPDLCLLFWFPTAGASLGRRHHLRP